MYLIHICPNMKFYSYSLNYCPVISPDVFICIFLTGVAVIQCASITFELHYMCTRAGLRKIRTSIITIERLKFS